MGEYPNRKGRPKRSELSAQQKAFLLAYVKHNGVKAKAADEVGVSRMTVYNWFKVPLFRAEVFIAESQWYDELIGNARDRATRSEKSDHLAKFLIERRDKIEENVFNDDGSVGAYEINLNFNNESPDAERNQLPDEN